MSDDDEITHDTDGTPMRKLVPARPCGDCNLCCKLMAVPPIDKQAGIWCQHATKGAGCAIYHAPERPRECDAFVCAWAAGLMPEEFKPSDVHWFMYPIRRDGVTTMIVEADDYPAPWMEPESWRYLTTLVATQDEKSPLDVLVRQRGHNVLWMEADKPAPDSPKIYLPPDKIILPGLPGGDS